MNLDITSYIIGYEKGKSTQSTTIILEGRINCADDGNGNITITEE